MFWDWVYALIEQRPRMTNLNLTLADVMDLPLVQMERFMEKLDTQRSREVGAAKRTPAR